MHLSDFLSPEQVVAPLDAGTLPGAIDALVERLEECGVITDPEKMRRRAAEDRAEDIVAMGDRAIVLHYRSDAVADLRVAIGVSPAPIARTLGADGGAAARVIALVVAPPRQTARHLQVVRGISRVLSRAEVVEQLLARAQPADVAGLAAFGEYRLPEQLTVRDLMTDRPRTTSVDTPLRDAAREMIRSRLGALPVVDGEGRLLGLLSERELMRHLLTTAVLAGPSGKPKAPGAAERKTVRDVMTRQVLCVAPEQPIAEVASLMTNKDVERVPVVREGRLVGFLTRGDIVRKLIGP